MSNNKIQFSEATRKALVNKEWKKYNGGYQAPVAMRYLQKIAGPLGHVLRNLPPVEHPLHDQLKDSLHEYCRSVLRIVPTEVDGFVNRVCEGEVDLKDLAARVISVYASTPRMGAAGHQVYADFHLSAAPGKAGWITSGILRAPFDPESKEYEDMISAMMYVLRLNYNFKVADLSPIKDFIESVRKVEDNPANPGAYLAQFHKEWTDAAKYLFRGIVKAKSPYVVSPETEESVEEKIEEVQAHVESVQEVIEPTVATKKRKK